MKPIAITICLALVLGLHIQIVSESDVVPLHNQKADILVLAKEVSQKYAVSYQQVAFVIEHESSLNPLAVGDHGLAIGLCQFHKATFDMYENKYFIANGEHLSYTTPNDQIILMTWMWHVYPQSKYQWSTYRMLKSNHGTNTRSAPTSHHRGQETNKTK